MAIEHDQPAHLEPRDDGHARVRSLEETESGRSREIYLIERQAIELRRRRWAEAHHEAHAMGEPVKREASKRKRARTPSADDDLALYERPPVERDERMKKGLAARATAWLRQTILGE